MGNEEIDLTDVVADRLADVIAIARNAQTNDCLSEGLKEEAAVLGRAVMVFCGHLMDELGVKYEQNEDFEEDTSKPKEEYKDGTILFCKHGKLKMVGNCYKDVNKVISIVTKLNVGSIKDCDNDKSCRKGKKDEVALGDFVEERNKVIAWFTHNGLMKVDDLHAVKKIPHCWSFKAYVSATTRFPSTFDMPEGWFYEDENVRTEIEVNSFYYNCRYKRVYVCTTREAYSELSLAMSRAKKDGLTVEEYLR